MAQQLLGLVDPLAARLGLLEEVAVEAVVEVAVEVAEVAVVVFAEVVVVVATVEVVVEE